MLSPTSIIFSKEDHQRQTYFHKKYFSCFSQFSFDMEALKTLMLLLIQLLKVFQAICICSFLSVLRANSNQRAQWRTWFSKYPKDQNPFQLDNVWCLWTMYDFILFYYDWYFLHTWDGNNCWSSDMTNGQNDLFNSQFSLFVNWWSLIYILM